ncbi:MAG: hypothetical protein ACRDZ3_21345 [Acidimicrobiia bacterium]
MVQNRITRGREAVTAAMAGVDGRLALLGDLVAQADEAVQAASAERARLLAPGADGPPSP